MSWIKASNVLGKYAINKQFRAAYICSAAQQVLGSEAVVVSFRDGTLSLAVSSSAQAANIQIQTSQILGEVNKKIGADKVTKLRFKVG